MAARIGVNRKAFINKAAQRGITPDYTTSTRAFYDEARTDAVRQQKWHASSM